MEGTGLWPVGFEKLGRAATPALSCIFVYFVVHTFLARFRSGPHDPRLAP